MSLVLAGLVVLVAPAEAQWSEPVNVSRITMGQPAWGQGIVVDSFSTLHACWSHPVAGDYCRIEYARKFSGVDTWTLPVRVDRDTAFYREAAIAIGPGHVPHVVWNSEAAAGQIFITHRSGDTWASPQRLQGWNGLGAYVAASGDDSGRVHVVWHNFGDSGVVWYARYDWAGWGRPEAAVPGSRGQEIGFPVVATDRYGRPHVAYACTWPEGLAALYVRRTDTGWTVPDTILNGAPSSHGRDHSIWLDSEGMPHIAWWNSRHLYYSHLDGDSLQTPVRLDSVEAAYDPSLCLDQWDRVSVFYSDWGFGFRERTRSNGIWNQPVDICPVVSSGKPATADNRLHLFFAKGDTAYRDIWYTCRDLLPPGIDEAVLDPVRPPRTHEILIAPGKGVKFSLDKAGPVEIDIFDTAGRCVARISRRFLQPGSYIFEPYAHIRQPGIFLCRVKVDNVNFKVKLVKAD